MKKYTLKAKNRLENQTGKNYARRLRRSGLLPANLISKGKSSLLSVGAKDLELLLNAGLRSSSIIDLEIEGDSQTQAIVKEMHRDPVHGNPLHIDFYRITKGEELSVKIGIESRGLAKGVKAGGTLEQYIRYLNLQTIPEALQEVIEIDTANLEIGQTVCFNELKLSSDWKVKIEGNPVVLKVTQPRIAAATPQEEEAASQEAAATAPEEKKAEG